MNARSFFKWLLLAAVLSLQGCVTYLTPGTGAPMRELVEGSDYNVAAYRKPAAQFPVRIAVAHLQSAGYQSFGARGVGSGTYSLVDVREVERDSDFNAMMDWPQVFGVVPLSRALMPAKLENFADLRDAARAAQADVVFAYTFDTTFHVENKTFAPEQEITLGVLPGREAQVNSTATGLFVDARTGFVYGLAQGNGSERSSMTQWTKPAAADDTRIKAERAAFTNLMSNAADTWKRIVSRYGGIVPVQYEQLQMMPELPQPAAPAAIAPSGAVSVPPQAPDATAATPPQ